MENQALNKYYIIDHQEGSLLDWCLSEYQQIMEYLKNSKSKVVISNSKTLTDKEGLDDETLAKVENCNTQLNEDILKLGQNEKFIFLDEGINSIIKNNEINQSKSLEIKSLNMSVPVERVCLLDLRGDKELSPSDYDRFDVFIFGGILGDNPPKDRTSYLRNEGFPTRSLGQIQMSTDTAVLTTKLIIEFKKDFSEIPFITEPEFFKQNLEEKHKGEFEECVCMEGFKFISNELDPQTGIITKKEKPKPLGHKKIYEDLIFQEFDPSMFI